MSKQTTKRLYNLRRGFVRGLADMATAGMKDSRFKKGYPHSSTYTAFYKDWCRVGQDLGSVIDRERKREKTS